MNYGKIAVLTAGWLHHEVSHIKSGHRDRGHGDAGAMCCFLIAKRLKLI
jgi:hypothetical protein